MKSAFQGTSFSEACNSIFSIKPNFSNSRSDDDAKRDLKLYTQKMFGGRILFPSIVVAGTKGKGSVSTVCESILRSCGWKTLLFTSPHLISPKERIKIDGNDINEADFASLYDEVMKELHDQNLPQPFFPNFFTLMFALLVLKYKSRNENKAVAIIEVGLGGKFDWTKFFRPTVSVITRLDFDHTEILGDTPYSIAWNKFGIITKDSLNFTIPQTSLFLESLNKLQKDSGRKLYVVAPNWKKEMGLKGPTAEINTSLAVAASIGFMKKIGIFKSDENKFTFNNIESYNNSIDDEDCINTYHNEINNNHFINPIDNVTNNLYYEKFGSLIDEGVKNAHIDGRYQIICFNGIMWYIDGAHTFESIKICQEWFEKECKNGMINNSKDSILLCAVSKNRDPEKTLEILLSQSWMDVYYVSSFGKIEFQNHKGSVFNNTQLAIQKIFEIHPKNVLVTGSLYLVSDVLKILKS